MKRARCGAPGSPWPSGGSGVAALLAADTLAVALCVTLSAAATLLVLAAALLFLLALATLAAALLVLLTLALVIVLVLILVGHDWFLSISCRVTGGAGAGSHSGQREASAKGSGPAVEQTPARRSYTPWNWRVENPMDTGDSAPVARLVAAFIAAALITAATVLVTATMGGGG